MTGCKKAIDYLKGNVFSPNTFYERAIGVLDVHHCITIIGPPGSGKTLTAVQLAYRKYEKKWIIKDVLLSNRGRDTRYGKQE